MNRKVFSKLIISILILCVLPFNAWGQKSATEDLTTLKQELVQAVQQQNQSKTKILANELKEKALDAKNFPMFAYAFDRYWDVIIQRKPRSEQYIAESDKLSALNNVGSLPWIQGADRLRYLFWRFESTEIYLNSYYYRVTEVKASSLQADSFDLKVWTEQDFKDFFIKEFQKLVSDNRYFSVPFNLEHKRSWSYRRKDEGFYKTAFGQSLGGHIFKKLFSDGGKYFPREEEYKAKKKFISELRQKLLDYSNLEQVPEKRIGAKLMILESLVQHEVNLSEEQKDLKLGLEQISYSFGKSDLRPYISYLINILSDAKMSEMLKNKYLIDFARRLERSYKNLSKPEQESIHSFKASLLSPVLDLRYTSKYLVGHKELKFLLYTRSLEALTIKLYAIPNDVQKLEEWKPRKGQKLLSSRRIKIKEDEDLKVLEQEMTFTFPHYGRFYLELIPQIKFEAKAFLSAKERKKGLRYSSPFVVTNKYVLERQNRGEIEGVHWLNADTGSPLASEVVYVSHKTSDNQVKDEYLQADSLGFLAYDSSKPMSTYYYFQSKDKSDPLSFWLYNRKYVESPMDGEHETLKAIIHTDSPIYNRGQDVQIFGYVANINLLASKGRVEAKRPLRLTLKVNGEYVKHDYVSSDEFGNFKHTIHIDDDYVLGRYSLSIQPANSPFALAYQSFSVEDVERKTYELRTTTDRANYKLGDTVRLSVWVKELNGGTLPNCRISCQVETSVLTPVGYWNEEESFLAEGSGGLTNAQGRSDLSFVLKKAKLNAKNFTHIYCILLRSENPQGQVEEQTFSIRVNPKFEGISLDVPDYLNKEKAETSFTCSLICSNVTEPIKSLSYSLYNAQGEKVLTAPCKLDEAQALHEQIKGLASGEYELEVYLCLASGESCTEKKSVYLFAPSDKSFTPKEKGLVAELSQNTFSLGDHLELYYATTEANAYLFYNYAYGNGEKKSLRLLRPQKNKLYTLSIPCPDRLDESLNLCLYMLKDGILYKKTFEVHAEQKKKKLDLKWEVLRKRVQAGSEETWKLRLTKDGKPADASVMAWLYDVGLDLNGDATEPNLLPTHLYYRPTYSLNVKTFSYPIDTKHSELMKTSRQGHLMLMDESNSYKSGSIFCVVDNESSSRQAIRKISANDSWTSPLMRTDSDGVVSWTFRMPERLSRWNFFLLAHTKDMYQVKCYEQIETFRRLELKSSAPSILRSGDSVGINYQLRNHGKEQEHGAVHFYVKFNEAEHFQELAKAQAFKLGQEALKTGTFMLPLPRNDEDQFVTLRLVAKGQSFEDGEELLIKVKGVKKEQVHSRLWKTSAFGTDTLSFSSLLPQQWEGVQDVRLDLDFDCLPVRACVEAIPSIYSEQKDLISLLANYNACLVSHALLGTPLLKDVLDSTPTTASFEQSLANPFVDKTKKVLNRREALTNYFKKIEDSEAFKRQLEAIIRDIKALERANQQISWFHIGTSQTYLTEYTIQALGLMRSLYRDRRMVKLWFNLVEGLGSIVQDFRANDDGSGAFPSAYITYLHAQKFSRRMKTKDLYHGDQELYAKLIDTASRQRVYDMDCLSKLYLCEMLLDDKQAFGEELLESCLSLLVEKDGMCYFPRTLSSSAWYDQTYRMQALTMRILQRFAPEKQAIFDKMKNYFYTLSESNSWTDPICSIDALYPCLVTWASEPTTQSKNFNTRFYAQKRLVQSKEGKANMKLKYQLKGRSKVLDPYLILDKHDANALWLNAKASYYAEDEPINFIGNPNNLSVEYSVYRTEGNQDWYETIKSGDSLRLGDRIRIVLTLDLGEDASFVKVSIPRLLFAKELRSYAKPWLCWSDTFSSSYFYELGADRTNFYFDRLDRGNYVFSVELQVNRSGHYTIPYSFMQSLYASHVYAPTNSLGYVTVLN